MLVRPINLSVWCCVKDNVVLQALCSSSNRLYTKSKSTMLRPLKSEVGYELSTSKWSDSDSSSSGFVSSNWLNSLVVLLNRAFSISSWLTMLLRFDFHLFYTPIYCFHLLISKTLCPRLSIERVNAIPLWDFYPNDFQRALKIIIIAELFIVMTISPG